MLPLYCAATLKLVIRPSTSGVVEYLVNASRYVEFSACSSNTVHAEDWDLSMRNALKIKTGTPFKDDIPLQRPVAPETKAQPLVNLVHRPHINGKFLSHV